VSEDKFKIQEQVKLTAFVTCWKCHRVIAVEETLDGDAVRTGNTTQTAKYWLDAMVVRVRAELGRHHWETVDEGWRCAHCSAEAVDPKTKDVSHLRLNQA
jgi:hypothetical protein